MQPVHVDDAGTAATLEAHELGTGQLGMVADERVQRRIDRNLARINCNQDSRSFSQTRSLTYRIFSQR